MEIRPATAGDAEGICRVARAAYREAYPDVLGTETVEQVLSEWYTPETIRENLLEGDDRAFVADGNVDVDGKADGDEDETGIVGFASGGPRSGEDADPGDGILGTLYVHPARWGEGVGTRLYDRVRADLDGQGVERTWIHVFADNDVGNAFYRKRAERVDRRIDELAGEEHPVNVYVDRFDGG